MGRKKEYVDRHEALLVFCDWCAICSEKNRDPESCDDILSGPLKKLPAADVRKNTHGEWVVDTGDSEIGRHFPVVVCNQCGRIGENDMKFCPHCGADMRGEQQ